MFEQAALALDPPTVSRKAAILAHYAVARYNHGHGICRAGPRDGAYCRGLAKGVRDLGVSSR